jgi:VanZ family protein
MKKPTNLIIFTITLLFMAGIIFVIIQADGRTMPYWLTRVYHFPNGDKFGHFILMGIAAFLLNLAAHDRSVTWLWMRIPIAPAVFSLAVAAEEYSQQYFPNRTASWLDLACSLLGILILGVFGSRWIISKFNRVSEDPKIGS